jgi:N-carbamoylputrescine amidase
MKIGLVAAQCMDNAVRNNINSIEYYAKSMKGCDWICFGESFLQGFEGLTWDYAEDLKHAVGVDSSVINDIRQCAKENNIAISFGFIEESEGDLYSSYMTIDRIGDIADLFRRMSTGWKEPVASARYKEGEAFHTFELNGLTFATAICGDLWDDKRLSEMEKITADAVLWPLYVDFSIERWQDLEKQEYAERVKRIASPVLLINSHTLGDNRANGGCCVFCDGKITAELCMGAPGTLAFELIKEAR